MSAFKDYHLWVPDLWNREWHSAIQAAKGAERDVLKWQARAADLLKQIDDKEATPDRIAWFTIWTRAFSILEGVLAGLSYSSSTVLAVLDRMSFECLLHVEAILEPIARMWAANANGPKVVVSARIEELAWLQVRQRLQAYTAWCLWNDRSYYADLASAATLAEIWDPAPGLRLIADMKKYPGIEKLLHGHAMPVRTDRGTIARGRKQMSTELQARLSRCDSWLEDSRLIAWTQRLHKLADEHIRTPSFFELLFEHKPSVSKRLREVARRFSYSQYIAGSMVIHGSSLDHIVTIRKGLLYPTFVAQDEECESLSLQVGRQCDTTVVFLALIQKILWG